MKIRAAVWLALAVAMSGYRAAGAPQEAPRVDFASRQPSSVRYLKVANPGEDDRLGIGDPLVGVTLAVSADGRTLAVSTPHEDSGATGINGNQQDESAWDSGAAYVFVRNGSTWMPQAFVKPSNTQTSDKFGFALALSGDGNTLAVGATLEDSTARGVNGNQADDSAPSAGAVYVFVRNGTTWSQQAYVKASNADAGDQFGWSVALSHDGSTLAVGAQSEASAATGIKGNQADNSAADAGAAYVFVRRGATWSQEAYVKASNTIRNAAFGSSIAVSADGSTLAVGAADEDSLSTTIDGDQSSVPIDEGSAGVVYVYTRTNGVWAQQAYVKSFNIGPTDLFGFRLAFSRDGSVLAAGAPGQSGGGRGINPPHRDFSAPESGAVYVFARNAAKWSQHAYIKATNAEGYDQFGSGVGLSADGTLLAAAANGEDGGSKSVDGDQNDNSVRDSGAVYVY